MFSHDTANSDKRGGKGVFKSLMHFSSLAPSQSDTLSSSRKATPGPQVTDGDRRVTVEKPGFVHSIT